jgi:hypothetical protein
MDERERRLAANEGVLKKLNEQFDRIDSAFKQHELHLLCECGDEACRGRIRITHSEYEPVHHHPDRFLVLPGHDRPELERVVARHPTYLVVEKTGEAEEVAEDAEEAADEAR